MVCPSYVGLWVAKSGESINIWLVSGCSIPVLLWARLIFTWRPIDHYSAWKSNNFSCYRHAKIYYCLQFTCPISLRHAAIGKLEIPMSVCAALNPFNLLLLFMRAVIMRKSGDYFANTYVNLVTLNGNSRILLFLLLWLMMAFYWLMLCNIQSF